MGTEDNGGSGYNTFMKRRPKTLLILITLLTVAVVSGWLLLPRAIEVLPGQIRVRLPDELVELVTTPLPTALPAPLRSAGESNAQLMLLATATATATTASNGPISGDSSAQITRVTTGPSKADDAPTRTPIAPPPTPTPTATSTPTPAATPLPSLVLLEGLKVTPQKYNNCGPANLAIVLNFYGHQVNQLEIGEALKPNYDDRNVSPHELAAYVADETELEARVFYGLDLLAIQRLLAAGIPVIIEKGLDLTGTHGWMGHYLTLYGYDESDETFYGLDTFLGPWDGSGRQFEFASLDELWAQFNRAAIVIYPVEMAAEMALALGSDSLDERAMWQAAAERARDALLVDAEDAFAWFDLGASLYHLAVIGVDSDYYEQSVAAFDRAREIGLPWRTLWYQFEPYLAYLAAGRLDEVLALTDAVLTTSGGRNIEETYLYRGHALLASGEREAAERAYERALRLNPGSDLVQEALQAMGDSATETVD